MTSLKVCLFFGLNAHSNSYNVPLSGDISLLVERRVLISEDVCISAQEPLIFLFHNVQDTRMNNSLFVGIDVSAESNTVALHNSDGELVEKVFAVPNNQPGVESLIGKLRHHLTLDPSLHVVIGCEATGIYSFHLLQALAASEELQAFDVTLYHLNPKLIHHFRKVLNEQNKTDLVDASVIAERLRFGHLPDPYSAQPPLVILQRLTRFRFHLVEAITKEKAYILNTIFLKFSAFTQEHPFGNSFGKTAEALLTEFTTSEDIAEMPLETLVDFLMTHGKARFRNPGEIAATLKKVARESYRLRPELAKSVTLILALAFRNIRALQESLKELDRAVAQEMKAFPNTLTSVPGIGPVFTAGIIAEIGDITRYPSDAQIAQSAGLVWKQHQSGGFDAEHTPMTKTGNKYLRYYLIQAANSLKNHNAEYRKYYSLKYREAKLHPHKRALALTARKFVRLVYALLSKQQLYKA
ncbi:MAG: IS110 family transposase [Candidatus Kryptoniota bacterium]